MQWYWDWFWTIWIVVVALSSFRLGWTCHRMTIEKIISSRTYKIRAPEISRHALYFTIAGLAKPEAFFLNSKDMKLLHWTLPLMSSYSKQLKFGAPIESIIKAMKETFDPNGVYVIPDGSGRKVNSLTHHFGIILEEHVITCKEEIANAKRKRAEKESTT